MGGKIAGSPISQMRSEELVIPVCPPLHIQGPRQRHGVTLVEVDELVEVEDYLIRFFFQIKSPAQLRHEDQLVVNMFDLPESDRTKIIDVGPRIKAIEMLRELVRSGFVVV